MKKELKKKFLPENYLQDTFLKLHHFSQEHCSVEQYTEEFDYLMMRCCVAEPEEQTILRYLGGFRKEIFDIVQLQPYYTYHEFFFMLVTNVERQLNQKKDCKLTNTSIV